MIKTVFVFARYYSRQKVKHIIPNKTKSKNPGLQKRLSLIQDNIDENSEFDIDLDDLETDFMNAGQTLKEHKDEVKKRNERVQFLITKRKYFQTKEPNFLTWQEKQQIRHLHNIDSEEWTVEKLSDSFPALPDTILKIIKAQWQPKSKNRIENHDGAVQENWKLLNENKIKLSDRTMEHIKKFSNRKLFKFDLKTDETTYQIPTNNEFKSLLKTTNSDDKPNTEVKLIEQPFQKKQSNKYQIITLDKFKESFPSETYKKEATLSLSHDENISSKKLNINRNIKNEFLIEESNYPQRINIPKNVWKKGYTYRIKDCYYDDDGEFLYRVIGMTGS